MHACVLIIDKNARVCYGAFRDVIFMHIGFREDMTHEFKSDLKKLQDENRMTELMVMQEEMKTLPYGDVWEEYLARNGFAGSDWFQSVRAYEKDVLAKRR